MLTAVPRRNTNSHTPKVPDFDVSILASCNQPFAFTVEGDGGDVHGVTVKGDQLIPLSIYLGA